MHLRMALLNQVFQTLRDQRMPSLIFQLPLVQVQLAALLLVLIQNLLVVFCLHAVAYWIFPRLQAPISEPPPVRYSVTAAAPPVWRRWLTAERVISTCSRVQKAAAALCTAARDGEPAGRSLCPEITWTLRASAEAKSMRSSSATA